MAGYSEVEKLNPARSGQRPTTKQISLAEAMPSVLFC